MTTQPTPHPETDIHAAILGVRIIAERVVLRIQGDDGWRLVELAPDQAKQVRDHLDEAITRVEAGESVLPSLPEMIESLPQ